MGPLAVSPFYLRKIRIYRRYFERILITISYNIFQGYLFQYPIGVAQRPDVPDLFCGRRKIQHKELIVNGKETLAGAWPWHVAINRIDKRTLKYICGGTIISKHFVLTGT